MKNKIYYVLKPPFGGLGVENEIALIGKNE